MQRSQQGVQSLLGCWGVWVLLLIKTHDFLIN